MKPILPLALLLAAWTLAPLAGAALDPGGLLGQCVHGAPPCGVDGPVCVDESGEGCVVTARCVILRCAPTTVCVRGAGCVPTLRDLLLP